MRAEHYLGKRELVALLSLSSWCFMILVWLFPVVPWNEGAARALDKKCVLMAFPPEPLVLIGKKITELFLTIPFI